MILGPEGRFLGHALQHDFKVRTGAESEWALHKRCSKESPSLYLQMMLRVLERISNVLLIGSAALQGTRSVRGR
jgi:hypothetical protein